MNTWKWSDKLQSRKTQYDVKRRALIQEAGRAFSKKGFYNTTLDEVAAVLNVSKTALYYYVKDKNEILLACHEIALDLGDEAMAVALSKQCSAIDRIVTYANCYIRSITSEFGRYAVLLEPISSLKPEDQEIVRKRRRQHDNQLRAWIREGISDGEIVDSDPAVMTAFMMGSINYIHRWFDPDGSLSGIEMSDLYSSFIRKAFLK